MYALQVQYDAVPNTRQFYDGLERGAVEPEFDIADERLFPADGCNKL